MTEGPVTTICSMRWALSDVSFFGGQLSGASWRPWRALLLAICGESLTDAELADFRMLTNRTEAPGPVQEMKIVPPFIAYNPDPIPSHFRAGPNPFSDIDANADYARGDADLRPFGFTIRG
jgi:hypothetical protein